MKEIFKEKRNNVAPPTYSAYKLDENITKIPSSPQQVE